MRPPEEVRKVLVGEWLRKADQDLTASEVLVAAEPPAPGPACFHAQQAAEKCLKALLTAYGIEFPKTHAIEKLLDLVEAVSEELATRLLPATALTPYGVEVRYPGESPEPTLSDAEEALALAQEVCDAVASHLEQAP